MPRIYSGELRRVCGMLTLRDAMASFTVDFAVEVRRERKFESLSVNGVGMAGEMFGGANLANNGGFSWGSGI